jgi:FMN phosphatase YigB (HAD superfamily)
MPASTPPRAVIFDIGNVLLKFNYFVAAERLRLRNGLHELPDREPIVAAKARLESGQITRADFLQLARPAFSHEGDDESFLEIWRDIFDPNQPMIDLAAQLSRSVPCYLLSNVSCIHHEYVFQKYPFFRIFRDGAFSYRLGCLKPEPRIYQLTLAQFGLAPEEVVLFDDMPENVAAARAEGWQAFLYDFRRHHEFLQEIAPLGLTFETSNSTKAP